MAWRDIWQKHRDTIDQFRSEGTPTGADVAILERKPTHPSKLLSAVDTELMDETSIAAYREAAKAAGVDDKDLVVEEFRAFLAKHDLPTFNLREVISYMDKLTSHDNPSKFGWHWCPVRLKDADVPMRFGTMAIDDRYVGEKRPGSDYYSSHDMDGLRRASNHSPVSSGGGNYTIIYDPMDARKHRSAAYTRTLPIHALKKIAYIEKHWTGPQVVFLVTDYTANAHVTIPDPAVNPDPFLMAVIDNSAVAFGKGRFVIDVWDEPGFGIEQKLK